MVFYTLVLLILFKKWAKTKKKMIRKTEKTKQNNTDSFSSEVEITRGIV